MKFGWLTLAHSPSPEADFAAIDEQLGQACAAETLGFDGLWLTEHNFTGESVYCDPIPFAGAIAARTSRIRIGFAVIQMSLRHPVRLAVQLALLDNLCKGRLDVGVGRGSIFNEYEYVGYGLRSHDSRERAAEAIDILKRAWTEAPFTHTGKYFQLSFPALRPSPYQKPYPPLWLSVVTAPSFEAAGRQGAPIMTARLSEAQLKERLQLYEKGLADSGLDKDQQARLRRDAAIWRHIYVAESRAQAEDELSAALLHTRQHMNHARGDYNPPDFRIDPGMLNPWTDPAISDAEGLRFAMSTGAICGTASDVAEQLAELRKAGVHHVLAQMSFGYLTHEKILRSMQLFSSHVMAKLR